MDENLIVNRYFSFSPNARTGSRVMALRWLRICSENHLTLIIVTVKHVIQLLSAAKKEKK